MSTAELSSSLDVQPKGPRLSFRSFLLLILVPLLLLRVAFVLSYSLNIGQDGMSYYSGMLNGKCWLTHAPGYNFLMGMPLRIPAVKKFALKHPEQYADILVSTQHGIDFGVQAVLLVTLCSIFGRLTGSLCVLAYGLSVFGMDWTSACRPEWLQGNLLILAFCTAYYACRAESRRRKLSLYCVSGVFMAWCAIVKPNALALAPFYAGFFLAESGSFRQRALHFGGAGLCAVLNYLAFLVFFHHPATGTYHLTYDKAFLFMCKISMEPCLRPLNPENGINTKRWLALNRVLPPEYPGKGWVAKSWAVFEHENAVPESVRQPFRETYCSVMQADEAALDEILRKTPLSEKFNLMYSFLPIAYYVGQQESESLATKVHLETLWAHREAYARTVLWNSWGSMSGTATCYSYLSHEPWIPMLPNIEDAGVAPREQRSFGFVKYDVLDPDLKGIWGFGYGYIPIRKTLWYPGMVAFSWLYALTPGPYWVVRLLGLTGVLALLRLAVLKGTRRQAAWILALAGLLVLFIVFSCTLHHFRAAELRAILAPVCLLLGVGVGWVVSGAWIGGCFLASSMKGMLHTKAATIEPSAAESLIEDQEEWRSKRVAG
jgi:hypothetical protein